MINNPAGDRNKQPILNVLKKYINTNNSVTSRMLEISSGPGLHACFFAVHFPNLMIQPTEYNAHMLKSIKEYKAQSQVKNVLDPIFLDISSSEKIDLWPDETFDFMLNINMIHITPWTCTQGLFRHSSKLLKPEGFLFTYGSYFKQGELKAESNVQFHQRLQAENPLWGVREISDLCNEASKFSIELVEEYNLPSDNKCLVWQKKRK